MIKLTDEEAQQISNTIATLIPQQYQQAYNAISILSEKLKEDQKEDK